MDLFSSPTSPSHFLSLPSYSPANPSLFLPKPLNQLGAGERCKLPQRGPRWSPGHKRIFWWYFQPRKRIWWLRTVSFCCYDVLVWFQFGQEVPVPVCHIGALLSAGQATLVKRWSTQLELCCGWCLVWQRHMELMSQSEKTTSKSVRKSKLQELSAQLMAVQLRETSLAAQVTELKQEALQLETAVSCHTRLHCSVMALTY